MSRIGKVLVAMSGGIDSSVCALLLQEQGYDVIYDCNDHLRITILGWMWGWAKPAEYRKEFDALPVKYKKIVRTVDIAVLAVVVLALVYPYLHK